MPRAAVSSLPALSAAPAPPPLPGVSLCLNSGSASTSSMGADRSIALRSPPPWPASSPLSEERPYCPYYPYLAPTTALLALLPQQVFLISVAVAGPHGHGVFEVHGGTHAGGLLLSLRRSSFFFFLSFFLPRHSPRRTRPGCLPAALLGALDRVRYPPGRTGSG